ncbi:MAG: tetratricopeptide repeat protein [Gammaproteobacteria bacterium]
MAEMSAGWTDVEVQLIREQRDRLLRSEMFEKASRQSRFLAYVIEEELAGRGHRVSQYAIAADVFDRGESFDPLVDSIVRVEARRLRSKLTEYYVENGRHDPVIVSLPKGHYRISIECSPGGGAPSKPGSDVATRSERVNSTAPARDAPANLVEKPSVAVLPFDNLSGDPEQEYFSDGITEDIITDLSRLSGLLVISRHSTFVYKGKARNTKEIGDDLGARYVLEGSVRKVDDRIRVSAQLIDASIDNHLWAERYDRKLDDVFAIQDDVARNIVSALKLRLTGVEDRRLGHRGTADTKAHDLFLRAQEQFYQFTPESVRNADALLSRSIEVDPNYAEAYAWRSRVLVFALIAGMDPAREQTMERALASARRAIALDDLLPVAHASLGWALMWNREVEEAAAEANRALELDPNFADGFLWHSLILSSAGRGEEALESIEQGIRLNPYYTVTYLNAVGIAHFALEQYEEALIHFERGVQRNPSFIFNHLFKTSTLGLLGRTKDATMARSRLLEFDQHQRVVRESFFFNNEALFRRYRDGLARAGMTNRSPAQPGDQRHTDG